MTFGVWRSRVFGSMLARFLLCSLVPLLTLSGIAIHIFSQALRQHIENKLAAISDGRAALINAKLDSMTAFVLDRAVSPLPVAAFAEFCSAFARGGVRSPAHQALAARYRDYFQGHFDAHDYLYDLLFVSRAGDVVFTVRREADLGQNVHGPALKGTPLAGVVDLVSSSLSVEFSDFDFYAPSKRPAFFIAAPVFSRDKLLGTLVAQIKPEALGGFSQNYTGLPRTGEIVFAKRSAEELVFTVPTRFRPDAALRLRHRLGEKASAPMQAALRGESGGGLAVDYRGKSVLARWRYIPRLNWGMVVKVDADDIFASLRSLVRAVWVICLLMTVIVFKLALDGSRAIAGPLEELKKGAAIVGAGDLDHRTKLDLDNEIGDLSRAFDFMAENLKTQTSSRAALEKEMAEKVQAQEAQTRQNLELQQAQSAILNMLDDVAESRRALQRRNQELEAARTELERSNQELEDFAHIVSHDLKAPLRGITSLSSWLEADYAAKLDEEGRHHLQLMRQRAGRMTDLINGILEYSRIHRLQEDNVPADLDRILDEALEAVAPPAGIKVVREGALPRVVCSPTRIQQVFQNLLDNAFKHMGKPQGEVRVSCADQGGQWRICVADDGPGIAEKHLGVIFKIFHPVATPGNTQGTGIGLAVVQKAVAFHGGKAWAESRLGEGSRFFFTLPKTA